jgi:muramoyltetrapeptide carboxypeptidase LdcA involved in peptidoglycan recycling
MAELRSAFADPTVAGIVCTFGGSTGSELVPSLTRDQDFIATVRANPKVFVGFSDITILHWALAKTTGLRTFYGPTAISELGVAPEPDSFTQDNLFRAIAAPDSLAPLGPVPRSETYALKLGDFLLGDDPESTVPQELAPTPAWTWIRGGQPATGPLFGGCLSIVVRMNGVSAIAPESWAGHIVFLETALEDITLGGWSLSNIRRALADLIAQGVFDNAAGLVFGRFYGYDSDKARANVEKVVKEAFCRELEPDYAETRGGVPEPPRFPILMHVDFGHTYPMITMPMGATARLDPDKNEFSILEAGTI